VHWVIPITDLNRFNGSPSTLNWPNGTNSSVSGPHFRPLNRLMAKVG